MNFQMQNELRQRIEKFGTVIADIVPHNGDNPYEIEFNHYEQSVADIQGFMVENEVYI